MVVLEVELIIKIKIFHACSHLSFHSSQIGVVLPVVRRQKDHNFIKIVQPLPVVFRVFLQFYLVSKPYQSYHILIRL